MMRRLIAVPAVLIACAAAQVREAKILDLKHESKVFGEERNFRVFLPPDYDNSDKRYPVVYFFHGWSERYNKGPRGRSGYDSGDEYGGDNIARFVGGNDIIVVKWDGYNPRSPGEDYPRPYNISPVETHRQFPLYFPELVSHIDSNFRTIAQRQHRATAGLSMGGFTSFWVAGKYPHLVGSASNFMGSSEFYVGPNGFPSEYRHTEMYRNYEGLRTRIVIGTRDFIRWYHRRMNAVWDFVRPHHEHEDFDSDHGTAGMAKTLRFHMDAFANPLPEPSLWHHIDVYPVFDVWGYAVETDRARPGFTVIENVSPAGFRSGVREWLPGGRLMPFVNVRITTDAIYEPGRTYQVTDVDLESGVIRQSQDRAGADGRLHLMLDGGLHEIGIAPEPSVIVSVSSWQVSGAPWIVNGKPARLRLSLVNKGSAGAAGVRAIVSSPNPDVRIDPAAVGLAKLSPGETKQADGEVGLMVGDPNREIVQLQVRVGENEIPLEILTFPDAPEIEDFVVADGTGNPIWERAIHRVEKVLGTGNADGKAQAGETVVIAVRDGEAYRPVEVLAAGPCAGLAARVSDPWGGYDNVGATAKYTLVLLSASCREGARIPLFVRYQIPQKPDHLLKQGVIHLTVSGKDRTGPAVVRASVHGWNRLEVELRDGGSIRGAVATLSRDGSAIEVPLNDKGMNGDRAAEDRIFTGLVPSPAPGRYSLAVTAEDEFGNSSTADVTGSFQFELPPPAPAAVR
jgi:hypothetical protein